MMENICETEESNDRRESKRPNKTNPVSSKQLKAAQRNISCLKFLCAALNKLNIVLIFDFITYLSEGLSTSFMFLHQCRNFGNSCS